MHPSLSPDRTPAAQEIEDEWARLNRGGRFALYSLGHVAPLQSSASYSRHNNNTEWIRVGVPVPVQQTMA